MPLLRLPALLVIVAALAACSPADAPEDTPLPAVRASGESARLALVIGNADYNLDGRKTAADVSERAGFPQDLEKPVNDASDIRDALERLSFNVQYLENATRAQMVQTLEEFGQKITRAGPNATVFFYYAGHAMQVNGVNLLLPVNEKLPGGYDFLRMSDDQKLDTLTSSVVTLPAVLRRLNNPEEPGINIVVLDACRNNWWDSTVNEIPRSARGPRSGSGLARGQAEQSRDLGATLIAYSTAPGNVADDGAPDARNSPYTTALKAHLEQPGLTVLALFNTVARDVERSTRDWTIPQRPWTNSVTLPDTCLAGCEVPGARTDAAEQVVAEALPPPDVALGARAILGRWRVTHEGLCPNTLEVLSASGKVRWREPFTYEKEHLTFSQGIGSARGAQVTTGGGPFFGGRIFERVDQRLHFGSGAAQCLYDYVEPPQEGRGGVRSLKGTWWLQGPTQRQILVPTGEKARVVTTQPCAIELTFDRVVVSKGKVTKVEWREIGAAHSGRKSGAVRGATSHAMTISGEIARLQVDGDDLAFGTCRYRRKT